MRVFISQKLVNIYKKICKSRFPIETYGFLLGHFTDKGCVIKDIYIPDDQDIYTTKYYVDIQEHWYDEADKLCTINNLEVVGDIHSHCYVSNNPANMTAIQSEGDIDSNNHLKDAFKGKKYVFGIMNVCKTKTCMRYKLRFWPEIEEIILKVVQ